jgi:hypothetical protein
LVDVAFTVAVEPIAAVEPTFAAGSTVACRRPRDSVEN